MRSFFIVSLVLLCTACSTGKHTANNNLGEANSVTVTPVPGNKVSGGQPAAASVKAPQQGFVKKEVLETQ